jgi:hypothetical protein
MVGRGSSTVGRCQLNINIPTPQIRAIQIVFENKKAAIVLINFQLFMEIIGLNETA